MQSSRRQHARRANAAYLPWRRVRQASQLLALALFLALLVSSRGGSFAALPPSLFFRLDPLAWATVVIAGRAWVDGFVWALATVGLTLAAGRVWCGWLCPLGTVLDGLQPPRRWWRRRTLPPERWRLGKYVLLLALAGSALAGSLTLLVLDPISLLARALTAFGLPALNQLLLAGERTLYAAEVLQPAVDAFDSMVRTPLSLAPAFDGWGGIAFGLLCAIVALNWVAPRFWCRYLCPLGAMLGALSRASLLRRVVAVDDCRACLRCARACPTGTINSKRGYASDQAECIVCLDCLPVCPVESGQRFALDLGFAEGQAYDPSRRQILGTLGLAFAGALVYPLLPPKLRRSPWLIRPPGAQGPTFQSACIRCSACVGVCPTAGLQPAIWDAGLDGLWTPSLTPRRGYCDYSCNACGQVCPTGAIPPLSLDLKRAAVIGRAEIDRERCLPWSQNTPCIVCEEMCPLAPKAITLETVQVTSASGQPISLQRPTMIPERCIGCGICEFKCPASGAAAIRIRGV